MKMKSVGVNDLGKCRVVATYKCDCKGKTMDCIFSLPVGNVMCDFYDQDTRDCNCWDAQKSAVEFFIGSQRR